jgi:hypothetical protein
METARPLTRRLADILTGYSSLMDGVALVRSAAAKMAPPILIVAS